MTSRDESKAAERARPAGPRLTARTADPRELYELAVQDPKSDVAIVSRCFERERGRVPLTLREHFCGSAFLCAEWIRSRADRRAIGVDRDRATIAWGRARHFGSAAADVSRVAFVVADVRSRRANSPRVDVVAAFNFSWSVFLERRELVDYFRRVRGGLVDDGLFALDLHGGPDSLAPGEDEQRIDSSFVYVWQQAPLDAITHRTVRRIHFLFDDGSERRDVFRYDWRVWTLPETREALIDAGFRRVDVLWEQFDARDEGNGRFRRAERAPNVGSWVAYLLAWR